MAHDTLVTLYSRACKWRGARELFVDERERIAGGAAWRTSERLAAALAALGLQPGDRVAFLCKPSVRHALAWFGVPLVGGVSCSLHVRETPARLGETIAWLDARFVIYDEDLAGLAHEALATCETAPRAITLGATAAGPSSGAIGWDDLLGAASDNAALERRPAPDDLAAIVLSSGSTGRPKGVMHTHRTLVETGKAGQALYGAIDVYDATLVMMQPSFAAWMIVVVPYVAGRAKVVFGRTFSPEGFLATLARERITMAPAVPTMWRMVFEAGPERFDLAALKRVSISGEPPARADLERIRARIAPGIASFYASSEAGAAGAVLATERDTLGDLSAGGERVGEPAGKPESTGRPLPNADVRIVDPAGGFDAELPHGAVGEILVSGPSLAIGYWRDDALTRARFRDGWWRSGDMGRIDADGDLTVLGRIDNVINSGGVKVHGEEVERALLRHDGVAQAAVVGATDARWGERIEAYVVPRPGAALDAATLDAFCRAAGGLAAFKVPKAFHIVASLPTGPTGKLYRRALVRLNER
jgi:acyl-CoA synthetase (AMP-forming)/AMP-acid ligase II